MANSDKKINFESSLKELESIVKKLEDYLVPLVREEIEIEICKLYNLDDVFK